MASQPDQDSPHPPEDSINDSNNSNNDSNNDNNDNNDNNNNHSSNETTPTPGCCSTSSLLPPWHSPQPSNPSFCFCPGLSVYNSLTRRPDLLWTRSGDPRLTWYVCGPTVYAPSHLGHARTYLSFDILRRLLEHYFGYHVTYIMNITDIDDKIIEQSLLQNIPFTTLARTYELDFYHDLTELGVALPTIVTRVTEYMDEIVQYIDRIIQRNLAYESHGSVYFDTTAFASQPDFYYGKLAPEQIGNTELLASGEGKLLNNDYQNQKRSKNDFALWKASKPHEPSWDSPWGRGRPGWHIECSVMATHVLRRLTGSPNMDCHSGGVDLKFPHHDNEMAQAEAESGNTQWVNYFLHSGHLHIKGLKMSKSLKNFVTIAEALAINSARQIRLLFLLHKYNTPMDYGDHTMSHALEAEKKFVEFFHNTKAELRRIQQQQQQQAAAASSSTTTQSNILAKGLGFLLAPQTWTDEAMALQRFLDDAKLKVDAALKDDFDTKTAMAVLADLVKAANVYMNTAAPDAPPLNGLVIRNVADYITRMFKIFGLIPNDAVGFPAADETVSSHTTGSSSEAILGPVLDALLDFRSSVREQARAGDAPGILRECDDFRDSKLPALGIRLEDRMTGSVWKLADPAELLLEQQQRAAEAERKAHEKEQQKLEAARKEALMKLPASEYMKQLTLDDSTTKLMYTQFDPITGLPTHDHNGDVLNKNQTKKAQKLFKAQEQKYEKYLKSL